MEESIFIDWITQYFPGLVLRKVESFNDEAVKPTYLFRQFLKKKFSIDGKWASLTINNQLIAVDVVSMDSSIPLKARPSLGKASGDIPKMGMEYQIREQELTELDTLVAVGQHTEAIAKFFQDTPLVIGGQYERLEAMFLELLSSGVCEYTDTETVGAGIKITAGFLTANQFDSDLPWSNSSATPITDLQQAFDKAQDDGRTITTIFMDKATFNKLKQSTEAKQLFATSIGNFGSTLVIPNRTQFLTVFSDEFNANIVIVDRSVRTQRDGANTTLRPWAAGQITLVTTNDLGSYVWAKLAEANRPVAGVAYETADDFILVSKFRMNRPSLMEVTNSQSRVVTVLDNVEAIYTLDSTVTTV